MQGRRIYRRESCRITESEMAIHKLKWSKVRSITADGMYGDGGNL